MTGLIDGAEPFLLSGGKKGILLVHGFTGAPGEMWLLGKYLQALGYTVLAPRLCGHGTNVREMALSTRQQWFGSVCDGYCLLKNICDEVSAVGLSMGGLLAIKLGIAVSGISRVAAISVPVYVSDERIKKLPDRRIAAGMFVPKKRRQFSDVPSKCNAGYDQIPVLAVHELVGLMDEVKGELDRLTKPFLLMHSRSDHTALPASAEYIYQRVGSSEKELYWLEKSGHAATLGSERNIVFDKLGEFFQ